MRTLDCDESRKHYKNRIDRRCSKTAKCQHGTHCLQRGYRNYHSVIIKPSLIDAVKNSILRVAAAVVTERVWSCEYLILIKKQIAKIENLADGAPKGQVTSLLGDGSCFRGLAFLGQNMDGRTGSKFAQDALRLLICHKRDSQATHAMLKARCASGKPSVSYTVCVLRAATEYDLNPTY